MNVLLSFYYFISIFVRTQALTKLVWWTYRRECEGAANHESDRLLAKGESANTDMIVGNLQKRKQKKDMNVMGTY